MRKLIKLILLLTLGLNLLAVNVSNPRQLYNKLNLNNRMGI